ncbi:A disintegrin and metalloproteinase with thrombospondin motifs 7 [Dendroctonus ponderosae]|uniref:A disintegrin and metalloproteinase with thrombospondin motifs 7 n=1 Tax=Dendroctonus ponderosae TaxID=77166 RepID=UPI002034FC2A|nr:A disintegrin and metalloproteinase with thrombospondin motifs 7 [Dendroctonus ponderosae]KAH1003192.1 hypothetical protein HUJ05_011132 [Dendroctonus ponderosae]
MGLACSKEDNCCLSEDAGLEAAVTIAHEIGHLVGMEHDGNPGVPCPNADPADNASYVMSSFNRPNTVRWSPCSMASMHKLSREHVLDCFKDEPNNDEYPLFDVLPGVVYGKDEQCVTHFRKSNVVMGYCELLPEFRCGLMYCKRPNPTNESLIDCFGDGVAYAPGTSCRDETQWCMRNKCVPKGTIPESIDGGWSGWSDWSQCSRTCGRGIQTKERVCDNPKPVNQGRYCTGLAKERRICNPQDCPRDAPAFRVTRCKADVKALNMTYLQADFIEATPCRSMCVVLSPEGTRVREIAARVIADGAKCKVGNPLMMCVGGVCTEIPCDNKMEGSTAAVDACGTCNGDGTMCRKVEYSDSESDKEIANYARMVTVVPEGARNVKIWNTDRCGTMIMLGLTDEETVLWNHLRVGYHMVPPSNLTFFKFTREYGAVNFTIQSDKRTLFWDYNKEDVGVYLQYTTDELDVPTNWSWMEPTTTPQFEPVYKWSITEFEPCSAKCDGGVQAPKLRCFEQSSGLVSDHFCEKIDKPTDPPQKCNEKPCKPEWKVGPWGKCRACRKKGGVRIRPVECVRPNPKESADDIIVEDSECTDERPGTVELCATRKKCVPRTRKSIFVPGQFQSAIWQQMHKLHLRKRGAPAHPLRPSKASTRPTTTFTWTPPPVSDILSKVVVDEAHMGDPRGELRVGQEIVVPIRVEESSVTEAENALMGPEQPTRIVIGSTIMETTHFANFRPNATAPCANSGPKP